MYTQDTFNIFKHKPVYITQSDDKGKYSIENLKPGDYYIYAIDDKNRNLIADSKSEMYGFLPEKIVASTKINQTLTSRYRSWMPGHSKSPASDRTTLTST